MKKHILLICLMALVMFGGGSSVGWAVNEDVVLSHFSEIRTLGNEVKADFNLLLSQILNMNLDKKGLAEGAGDATLKTTSTGNVAIGGVLYSIGATDNVAMTAAATQNHSTEVTCNYLVSVDSGGSFTVTKGDGLIFPALPANQAPIGYFRIVLDAGGSFISGTTDLSATSVNATFYDLMIVPNGSSAATAITAPDLVLRGL